MFISGYITDSITLTPTTRGTSVRVNFGNDSEEDRLGVGRV